MRQSVAHLGATIDTATPEEVAGIIARAFELQWVEEYERKKGVIQLDATGAGSASIPVPSQYDWLMERVTIAGAGSVSALVQIFENQQSGTDLLEVISLGTAGLYSDSFSNRIYVTANSQIVVAITGGVANGQSTFNLQIRLKQHRGRQSGARTR